jgi:signal transduction histidine kinase
LYLWKDEKLTRYTTGDGLSADAIRTIGEDHEGTLWIGTDRGLTQWKDGKFSAATSGGFPTNTILSFYEDHEHTLWIGTSGKGLYRLTDGRCFSYTTGNGLFDDSIHAILEDDTARLWMTCRHGVFRANKSAFTDFDAGTLKTIPCISYGRDDGLVSLECSATAQPSAWKSKDGRLWFATARGLAVTDPRSTLKKNEMPPPPVAIEQMVADKRRFEVAGLTFASSHSSNSTPQTLNLTPRRGDLEFHYTALSFRAPEKNRYKYKLEGIDLDWVDAGTRRIAYYNNTPPGDYTFHVMACNNDGVWNMTGASMKFTLQPHYWQTWWFKAFVIIGGLSFVATSARYATKRRMQFKLERLEQQHAVEKERTRIAQDMHDDLGARLSEILLLSNLSQKAEAKPAEIKTQLGRISDATHDLVDNLDAIVWAVNPKNDSFNRFVFYLYEYVPRYLEATSIRCLFDVPQPLLTTPLSSTIRHDLFLVLKEALNNIVKHAQATEVRLSLRIENGALIMTLADNGQGFPAGNTSLFGNGLNNMRDRVEKVGGSFELHSEAGKGTSIALRIPIRREA